jgi:hypothetical protein
MADAISEANVRTLKTKEPGVLTTAMSLAPDLAENGLRAAFGITRSVHAELFRVTNGAVDWLQSVEQVPFKVTREVLQHAEKLTSGLVGGVEVVGTSVIRALRGSADAACETVSRTPEALVG